MSRRPEDDVEGEIPDPPEKKLFEQYRAKFGEWPPAFEVGAGTRLVQLVKRALRTGERIKIDLDPGEES